MAVTRRVLLTGAAAGVVAGMAGCTSSTPRTTATRRLTDLTVAAGAAILGRECAVAVAQDRGFFRAAGIGQVKLIPGQATAGNLALLAAGKVDLAAVDMSEALAIRERGNGDWRIVMAVHQRYTGCLIGTAPNLAPADLPGKSIAGIKGGANVTLFPLYAKLAGFDASTVRWVYVQAPDLIKTFASGRVDVVTQQTLGRASVMAATGRSDDQLKVLPYSDYLYDLYGNLLAVRADLIRRNRAAVRGFVAAYARALAWSVTNVQQAAEIFARTQPPPASVPAAAGEIAAMRGYVDRAGLPVGGMTRERVARAIALIRGGQLIQSSPSPEDIVDWSLVPGGGV